MDEDTKLGLFKITEAIKKILEKMMSDTIRVADHEKRLKNLECNSNIVRDNPGINKGMKFKGDTNLN